MSSTSIAQRWGVAVAGMALAVGAAGTASAGPVVRQASGATPASIQAAVDTFRGDLGGANNGNAAGTQASGRREINWDGGGGAATITLDPSPMTRFGNRGAVFVTPGAGFEISGQPSPELGDVNATYPALFAAFSAPRLFIARNTNVMDVLFTVPASTAVAAASTGFGAVFTDVDAQDATWMEFYAPDGALLGRWAVPYASGDETFSFLGVSFDAGEVVGRVRIVTGNAAPGPDEAGGLDLVAMDDFIYGEPVATAGLTITPESGRLFRTGAVDLVIGIEDLPAAPTGGRVRFDGIDVTGAVVACFRPGALARGQTLRCPLPRAALQQTGEHVLQVEVNLADGSRRRNAVRWTVLGNNEP
jgi:hypothetical protein